MYYVDLEEYFYQVENRMTNALISLLIVRVLFALFIFGTDMQILTFAR